MLKRNTSGLQEYAQKKRESAFDRTEQAIQKLLKAKKNINFGTVAQEAGVSRTWLYNQTEIKERIEELRNKKAAKTSRTNKLVSFNQTATKVTNSPALVELQQRIKKLETENLVLRQHLEVVYGLSDTELVRIVEVLQVENAEFKRQLQEIVSSSDIQVVSDSISLQHKPPHVMELERKELQLQVERILQQSQQKLDEFKAINQRLTEEIKSLKYQLNHKLQRGNASENLLRESAKIALVDKKTTRISEISDKIQLKLKVIGISLNTTLTKTIKKAASEEIVLFAIEALEEALERGHVENPGGWLNTAIKDGWIPSEKHLPGQKAERNIFKEWFDLAYKRRLVLAASKGDDGQMYVYNIDGVPLPFKQMLAEYPLDRLK